MLLSMVSTFANLIHVKACNFHCLLSVHHDSCCLSPRTTASWNPQFQRDVSSGWVSLFKALQTGPLPGWDEDLAMLSHWVQPMTPHLSPDFLAVDLQQKSRSSPKIDTSRTDNELQQLLMDERHWNLALTLTLIAVRHVSLHRQRLVREQLAWAGRQPGRPRWSFIFLLTRKVHWEWNQKCERCPL